jgi:hypothetical protein
MSAVERLLRFDTIRISKLLELIQTGIIVFVLSFYLGSLIDKLFNQWIIVDDSTQNTHLVGLILLQLIAIIITAYYINKFIDVIPFMLSVSPLYKSNAHGEVGKATGLAMSIIFVAVQSGFLAKLNILKRRFALN